jgi:hypothetical protein
MENVVVEPEEDDHDQSRVRQRALFGWDRRFRLSRPLAGVFLQHLSERLAGDATNTSSAKFLAICAYQPAQILVR